MFKVGQALMGKLRFKDGDFPQYSRPYLIVKVTDDFVEVLNVSGLGGKEHKAMFHTNYKLSQFSPPFIRSSFVKLDSLTVVNKADWHNFKLLDDGKCLNSYDLNNILNLIRSCR